MKFPKKSQLRFFLHDDEDISEKKVLQLRLAQGENVMALIRQTPTESAQWHNKYNHQDNSTTAVAVVLLRSNFYLHALVWPT